jgi:hypothetical protein
VRLRKQQKKQLKKQIDDAKPAGYQQAFFCYNES